MPLPWKKQRVSRISRIVADLQSSPKRGGSLVVQTGFPTSLIDLFVKNRERIKKKKISNKNIANSNTNSNTSIQIQQLPSDPIPAPTLSGSVCFEADKDDQCSPTPTLELEIEEEIKVACTTNDKDKDQVVRPVLNWTVFVLVVLAIVSTKRVAVVITVFAFVLILADYVCKRFSLLEGLIERVEKKGLWVINKIKTCEAVSNVVDEVVGGSQSNSVIEEIEIVETGLVVDEIYEEGVREIVSVGHELEKAKEVKEVEGSGEKVLGCKRRLKAKKLIKKLVPKRLRNLKKEKKGKGVVMEGESSSDISSHLGDEFVEDIREQNQSVCKSLQEEEEEEEKCEEQLGLINQESRVASGAADKREGRKGEGSLGYLSLTLLVIVLAGLAGGRVVALTITVSWCFMLKLIVTRRRSVNVPMTRCPVPISS
uniref:Transmembrane protein n=1 Tax=Fagus sylvatica TaxID=28930 RepID=A0A2N9ESW8_FAGSY